MFALDFFIEVLNMAGEMALNFVNSAFSLPPVRIVLSVLFGLIVLGIVFVVIRGRKF